MYILFGILPEVLMFSLFLIFAKDLKENRILLTLQIFAIYLFLKLILGHTIYFNLIFIFSVYILLKILYKQKAQITDIFLMNFTSILLTALSCLTYFFIPNYFVSMIVNRLLIVIVILLAKKYLRGLFVKFNSCWNRNREKPNKIRSLTLRNISIISFNVAIFIIDLLLHIQNM